MGKHIKWLLFALGVLLVLFSINQLQQRNLSSNSDQIFSLKRDDVFQFQITKVRQTNKKQNLGYEETTTLHIYSKQSRHQNRVKYREHLFRLWIKINSSIQHSQKIE